jgi:hypothetical protein
MRPSEPLTRRRFLGTVATIAGSTWISGRAARGMASDETPPAVHLRPITSGTAPSRQVFSSIRTATTKRSAMPTAKSCCPKTTAVAGRTASRFPTHARSSSVASWKRERDLQRTGQAVLEHGQPADVPTDHGERPRRLGLPAARAAEPGSSRLVLPQPDRSQYLGRQRCRDAGLGQLLQRHRRPRRRSTSTTRPIRDKR